MKLFYRICTLAIVIAAVSTAHALPPSGKGTHGLATITGTVRDNKGAPLAGAVVQLIREGAKQIVKQTYTAADGSFSARIPAGKYSLKAVAKGFTEVLFESVQVNPSAEIAYRFNLEPANSPHTLVNQRNDKDNVKWTLRSTQNRKSIFQANPGDDKTVAAVEASAATDRNGETQDATDERGRVRLQGVAEQFFAASSNPLESSYEGFNFAFALPASDSIDLVFAGQTGIGATAPQRFETTAHVRLNDRHRLTLNGGGARLFSTIDSRSASRHSLGQMSVRAIDEWLVRDGVVVVMGLDYSRFTDAGND